MITRRGPGLRARLALISLVLLALPWLVVRYQREIDAFVLEGRTSALLLAAQGVATVLHDREDLFDESGGLPVRLGGGLEVSEDSRGSAQSADFAPALLEAPIRLDGRARDWNVPRERRHHYGAAQTLRSSDTRAPSLGFDLSLGLRRDLLYALFEVSDDVLTYRPDRYRSLDRSDHLRLSVRGELGTVRRFVITAMQDGPISVYEVGESWRYALGEGSPELRVRGQWRATRRGYNIELRLPIAMLGVGREVGFAVADVDRAAGEVIQVVGTYPAGESERLNLARLDSAEIERILRGFHLPGARIAVIDHLARVRAEVGAELAEGEASARSALLAAALAGQRGAGAHSGAEITRAVWPIADGDHVMGAVLVEQSNRSILGPQRAALERVLVAMAAACLGIAALLWLFAWSTTRRIQRLRDAASAAIDASGRVRRLELRSGRRARDEIGDLSRTISALLGRLSRYTTFLEEIPRTLRHELSNPLNTFSTSLQNLVHEHPEIATSKYVASAERGVQRASEILEGLTDAASLEEALRDEESELLDLSQLVTRYVENVAPSLPGRRFALRLAGEGDGGSAAVLVRGSGSRAEQLLDKLIDNAVSFSPEGSEIAVGVEVDAVRGTARLCVSNEGPLLPDDLRGRLFDSMVTSRKTRSAGTGDRPHLGIGLYVVGLIAAHMDGHARAVDREDGRGVVVSVELPLAAC